MPLQLCPTEDGSFTLYNDELDEIYHSRRGAVQESLHVFIQQGLLQMTQPELHILEVGWGTGLNFWLSLLACKKRIEGIFVPETIQKIKYVGIEPNLPPIDLLEKMTLPYWEKQEYLENLHKIYKNGHQPIKFCENSEITLELISENLQQCTLPKSDLVYYDVFGYRVAPELWSVEALSLVHQCMHIGGIFVTYSSKSIIRKNLSTIGFEVKKVPGPKGKREMVVAKKIS